MDKQIEEMAKCLDGCPYLCEGIGGNKHNGDLKIAEYLYHAGYRKIPENAVVMTEGEYSDMLSAEVETIERDIAEYWANEDAESVAKELHKDGYRKLDDHAILVLRKAKGLEEKVRKETAEKFAERVKEETDHGISALYDSTVDKIAKEITEGDNG